MSSGSHIEEDAASKSACWALLGGSRLSNNDVSPLFQAVKEATEEAVYNSLFKARTVKGYGGRTVEALPLDKVLPILKKYRVVP